MSIALAAGNEALPGYCCVRRLGRSSRGETWLTRTEDDSHRVLKWIIDGSSLRNARKLTNYRHPFLINWERCEVLGSDLYLIADWAEETLDVQLAERRAQGEVGISHDVLFRYLEELAEVLDYLHVKHQLVHGRLSVSQVGIQHRHVKLLDWGLLQPDMLLQQHWSLASLQNSAPEVLCGKPEAASDQFSLAALYLEAGIGSQLLPAKSLPDFFQQRQEQTYDSRLVSEPERVVLSRALHNDPAARYPTCVAFVKALQKTRVPTKPLSAATMALKEPAVPVSETLKKQEPSASEPAVAPEVSHEPERVPTVIIKSLVAVETGSDSRHPDSAFLNLNNLAYHSKVQSYGILTPTMILGLGRHGHSVLHELTRLCHERFDGISHLPHIRIVGLDQGASEQAPATPLPDVLGKEHFFHCPVPLGDELKASCQDSQITSWLPAEHRSEQNGSTPGMGRLAFALRYQAMRKRLQDECKLMLQSESLMQATQLTGLSIKQDLTPTFYLVAGLDEGISSGIIADLSYLLRTVIAETGWGNGKVYGLFFLPHEEQPDQVKAQAYASLVELNHYTQESRFSAHYTVADELTFPHQPFDEAYFHKLAVADQANPNSSLYRETANWLLRDVSSPLGGLRQASREATRAFTSQATPWYGNGLTTLHSSYDQVKSILKNKLRGKLISHWLDHKSEMGQDIRRDGEQFVDQHIYSASALLERFQHMAAIVLGREPAHMIEEWVAPLRKGAAARPSLESLAREIIQKVELHFGTSTGYQNSPVLAAIQQEAESVAEDVGSKITPLIMQYLDKPGWRLGASLQLGKLLLYWVNHQLSDLQTSHLDIHQDMIRAERAITQMMAQEERSFAIMNKQRIVSQIVQDLMDYPNKVLKEDMFARAVHVFQHMKKSIEDCLKRLHPIEKTLRELQNEYLAPVTTQEHLLLDGEQSIEDRCNALIQLMPADVYLRLDADLAVAMTRFQSNYTDMCLGKGPSFHDVLGLLDNPLEESLEGMLPSEDAAEQLLTMPSQAVVEQLRQSYRDARPDLMENKRSRQGAFCLLLTPNSEAGQELLQMAQATLPQIVAAQEGQPGEILLYRETGCLLPHEIYPQGKEAYDARIKNRATSPHSRFDITYWHVLTSSPPPTSIPTPSAFELPK